MIFICVPFIHTNGQTLYGVRVYMCIYIYIMEFSKNDTPSLTP